MDKPTTNLTEKGGKTSRASGRAERERLSLGKFLLNYNAVVILLLLIIASSIVSPHFLSKQNIFNVLRQQVPYALIAIGMMLTIVTGGIDLSASAICGCGSVFASLVIMKWGLSGGMSLTVAIVMAILLGCALGAVNGVLIGILRMPPFIVTLAMMTAGQGLAYMLTGGAQIQLQSTNAAAEMLTRFGSARDAFGVPLPVYLALAVALIFFFLMKFTPFGRTILAVGSNEAAVKLAGLSVTKYKIIVYTLSGALAALAGVVISARTALGAPVTSSGDFALNCVAACCIGGVALEGGKGTIPATMIGVLILALITNIMNLLSVPAYPQKVIQGFIIVFAIFLRKVGDQELSLNLRRR